jgi:hypothetical protein
VKADPETTLLAMLRAAGLPEPVREYPFALPGSGRMWRFDYAWPGESGGGVALEVEGGLFGRGKPCPLCKRRAVGAHTSIERLLSDLAKYSEAAVLGWRVIRCTPGQVVSGEAMGWLERALRG